MTSQDRLSNNYGAIPQPIDDKDTEPNLFAAPLDSKSTAPHCYYCGRSSWDYDYGFEAGIAYALTQVQGLLQQGSAGQKLEPEQAAALVDWMRRQIQPKP